MEPSSAVREKLVDAMRQRRLAPTKRAALAFVPLSQSVHALRSYDAGKIVALPSDAVESQARDLVQSVECLCREGKEDEAMDLILDALEGFLRGGEFREVDAILAELDPNRVEIGVCLMTLTITWHGRLHLEKRSSFLARAEEVLRTRLGDQRTEVLLATRR